MEVVILLVQCEHSSTLYNQALYTSMLLLELE